MVDFTNPFRPGAGHKPPYLAGRSKEKTEFTRLLDQQLILENVVFTGLRGVGKTVLLDSLKPSVVQMGWLWVGTDLSESACVSEDSLATRLCADLSVITSGIAVKSGSKFVPGFSGGLKDDIQTLNYQALINIYKETPGLALDKIKQVLSVAWGVIRQSQQCKGIVFAYDEAQNLSDQAAKEQFPLSLLLDAFQSLQKQGLPLMLVLTGLPTLFPKLVEARTYSERMFRVLFLESLSKQESEEAIIKPIEDKNCPLKLNESSVSAIVEMSGGYPYFIQFICREVYDAFMQRLDAGEEAKVPVLEIERKLDSDFFAGRWARATDRQRELLVVISYLPNCNNEFSVQEIEEISSTVVERPFAKSNINQMLSNLISQGLIFKNRHGKYSFAVPLLGHFIQRQLETE